MKRSVHTVVWSELILADAGGESLVVPPGQVLLQSLLPLLVLPAVRKKE